MMKPEKIETRKQKLEIEKRTKKQVPLDKTRDSRASSGARRGACLRQAGSE